MVRFKTPLEIPVNHCHKCQLSQGPPVFEGREGTIPPRSLRQGNHFLFDMEGVCQWRLLNALENT